MACPALHDLAELLVGNAVSDEIRAHVDAGCESCRKRLAMLRRTTLAPVGGSRGRGAQETPTDVDAQALTETPNVATAETQTPDGLEPQQRVSMRLMHRGERIGRYVVTELLGAGGMGVVYAALDPQLDRRVAVKVLRSGFARNVAGAKKLLIDEAKAMAKLSHVNVVTVHDVGVMEDQVFLAMELVEGKTLRDLMRDVTPGARELRDVLVEAGRGLAAAHKAGLVHRDFKPENVLIGRDGRVCVSDFGIARSADVADAVDVAGTPLYMAPEAHDGVIDPRSDQYSFCVTALEAMTGVAPTPMGKPQAQLERAGAKVPVRIRRALARGLASEPTERFASMEALLAELAPRRARRAWIATAVAGVAVAAAAAVTVTVVTRGGDEPCRGAARDIESTWSGDADAAAIRRVFAGEPAQSPEVERAIRELEEWRGRWVSRHTSVCRATRVDGAQSVELLDLRMECLRSRANAIAAIVDQLRAGDRAALAFASTSVPQAGDLSRCAGDRDALRSLARVRDPVLAAQADSLRVELAELEAKHLSGRFRTLAPIAQRLAERGDALSLPMISAPARYYEGYARAQMGDKARALELLQQAVLDADRSGDDELRMRTQVTLAQISTIDGKLESSEQLLAAIDATAGRLGKRPEHVAALLLQRSKLLFVRGQYAEALPLAQEAYALYERSGKATDPAALAARLEIGMDYESLGNRAEARASYEGTLAQIEERLGKDAPHLAPILTYLGNLDLQEGKLAEGRARLERSIALLDRALGEDAIQTTITRGILASLYAQAGELDHAREQITRALALLTGTGTAVERGALQLNLGDIERSAGRFAEATAAYSDALAAYERYAGADHPMLVEVLARRAQAFRGAKQYPEAKRDLDRATAIMQTHQLGDIDQLQYMAGQLASDAGRPDDARAEFEKCAGAAGKATQPMMTALCEFELAKMLPAGERARALRLARHARGVFAEGGDQETAQDIDAWLASVAK